MTAPELGTAAATPRLLTAAAGGREGKRPDSESRRVYARMWPLIQRRNSASESEPLRLPRSEPPAFGS